MEARTTCRRSAIAKNIATIVAAVVAVIMVGAIGGYVVKTLSLQVAAPSAHVVAGSVALDGSASNASTRNGGTMSTSFREPGSRLGGPQP